MLAVFKKEFKSYFMSPIGYIFVAVFMFLSSMPFTTGVLATQTADIGAVFSEFSFLYLFLISILTMKLFAEEKNKKTDQLLLTSPVSITELVIGKYLSAMAVFGVTVVASFVYPAIMFMYASPVLSEIIGSYIGFILLWGALISVGVFVSALTESQTIAGVFTFAILFVIYCMAWFESMINIGFIRVILDWFAIFARYGEFQKGIVDIQSVVYYLSIIFVFLFLTIRVIDKRRYS